jgi:hypothetical protein
MYIEDTFYLLNFEDRPCIISNVAGIKGAWHAVSSQPLDLQFVVDWLILFGTVIIQHSATVL